MANEEHQMKRIVLPSGKTIEVVYFRNGEDVPAPDVERHPPAEPHQDLHVCLDCDSRLVYPVEWEEVSGTQWEVLLRCPSCEWTEVGVYDQQTVDRFDEQLDLGTETLIRDLKRLQQANMEDETDRFVRALNAGAILPEDF